MEYLRKEERKDCLGNRAELRGMRRAEVRKERVMGFMVMMVVTRRDGKSVNAKLKWGRYMGREHSDLPVCETEDST